MQTIFSVPKPFVGHINTIQRNAIKSWTLLRPKCEVLLIGDEPGTAEIAAEFGLVHHREVERNEFGTPLVSSIFEIAQRIGKGDRMMYTNCDMIFMNDLMEALDRIELDRFLMVGRRWDLKVNTALDFAGDHWRESLLKQVRNHGRRQSAVSIDYFGFPRYQYSALKPLAVGRVGWDNWLIWWSRKQGINVIDVTPTMVAVHQNHDHSHLLEGEFEFRSGIEAQNNLELSGGWINMFSLNHANWQLTEKGFSRPPLNFLRIVDMIHGWIVIKSKFKVLNKLILWTINPNGPTRNVFRKIRNSFLFLVFSLQSF